MHRVFQSFVDGLAEGSDVAALQRALAEIALAFEIPLFAYFSPPSKLNPSAWLVSNYPRAWTDKYVAGRFDQVDPVIAWASSRAEPFLWSGGMPIPGRSAGLDQFFDEAAQFGIAREFTVPIPPQRGGPRTAAMTFAADAQDPGFLRMTDRHAAVFQLIAVYFHRHASRVLSADRVIAGVRLTRREFQCLHWAARGKSAWDIGGILGISRRTAAFHLDNARAKLGVRSIAQAVALLAAPGPAQEKTPGQ